jgi:RecA-family ATPase
VNSGNRFRIDISHRRMLLVEAKKHAKAGRPVLLLHGVFDSKCTCEKSGCGSPGKHPIAELTPKGHHDATTDIDLIRSWIDQYPEANLGLVPKGFCVFDYDGPEGMALRDVDCLPPTASARTGKGRHDWFLADNAATKIRSRAGFDVKGENGYVVVQPSRHISGNNYRWVRPLNEAIALPKNARDLLDTCKPHNVDRSGTELNALKAGSRNDGLTKIAGSLRRQSLGAALIATVLQEVNKKSCDPPLKKPEVIRIAKSVGRYDPSEAELFAAIDDVEEKIPEFVWYPWILKGGVTVFEGMPAQGKSFLTMKIATEVSRGGSLPGQGRVEAGKVLVLNPEDDAGYTIKPRLHSMGANLKNVRYGKRLFNFTDVNLASLQAEIEAYKIKLVTVDPLTAFLGGEVDLYRDNEVRQYMAKLAEIASASNCSFVVVRHLTKATTNDPMSRGSGSIGITASARSVVLVGKDPDDPEVRAMAHIKMNIAKAGRTLTFALQGGDARLGQMPKFIWCGESDHDAAAILSGPKKEPGRPADVSSEARHFLQSQLSKGPKTIAQLTSLAESRSISSRTLRRVAKEMALGKCKVGKVKAWMLPAKTSL